VMLRAGEEAKIRFYAWAHPSQMPLTFMRLDFADTFTPGATIIDSPDGPVSNYKPICDESGTVKKSCKNYPELSCRDASDCNIGASTGSCEDNQSDTYFYGFGNSESTGCRQGTFEASYIYECPLPDVSNFNEIPDGKRFPAGPYGEMIQSADPSKPYQIEISEASQGFFLNTGDIVCVYQPKIQLVDNWGWCTGGCYSATKNSPNKRGYETGCYNDPFATTDLLKNQCKNYLNGNHYADKNYSYVPYNGHVIVIPSEKF